jgi:hypothetical protein
LGVSLCVCVCVYGGGGGSSAQRTKTSGGIAPSPSLHSSSIVPAILTLLTIVPHAHLQDLQMQKRQRDRMGIGSSTGMGSTTGGSMGGMGSGSMGGMGSGSMGGMGSGGSGGGGGGGYGAPVVSAAESAPAPSRGKAKRGGLKLGSKSKKDTAFVDQLMAEGQDVADTGMPGGGGNETAETKLARKRSSGVPEVPKEPFHIRVAEEICIDANRDGGLESMVVSGFIYVHVSGMHHQMTPPPSSTRTHTHTHTHTATHTATPLPLTRLPNLCFPLGCYHLADILLTGTPYR